MEADTNADVQAAVDDEPELNLTHMVRPANSQDGVAAAGNPGLLLLHGRGADEADLMALEEVLDDRLIVISARAPFKLGFGYAWYGMTDVGRPDPKTLQMSLDELKVFVEDIITAYKIDPGRIYFIGFSQGAIVASALALTAPELVRGVIMHSGYVPTGLRLAADPGVLRDKAFLIAHGEHDDIVPVSFARESKEFLEAAGARLTYAEYPIGHMISEESLFEFSRWLTDELDRDDENAGAAPEAGAKEAKKKASPGKKAARTGK